MPDKTESMASGDDQLSDMYTKVDAGIGVAIGGAPPSNYYVGHIRSDGTKHYVNTNPEDMIGSINIQRGFSAYELDAVERQAPSNEIRIVSFTFAAIAGRKYLIEWTSFFKANQVSTGVVKYIIRRNSDNLILKTATYPTNSGTNFANPLGQSIYGQFEYVETVTTSRTFSLNFDSTELSPGSGLVNVAGSQSTILVTDWGV